MTTNLTPTNGAEAAPLVRDVDRDALLQAAVVHNDLSSMSDAQKLDFYLSICEATGLNPIHTPFKYLLLSGRLQLYATKACTDQLRHKYGISTEIMSATTEDGIYTVRARGSDKHGRTDEDIGCVPLVGRNGPLRGEQLCNAKMKCTTKAKRRVTLSMVGLGFLDESELDTVSGAELVELPSATPGNKATRDDGAALTAERLSDVASADAVSSRAAFVSALAESGSPQASPTHTEEKARTWVVNHLFRAVREAAGLASAGESVEALTHWARGEVRGKHADRAERCCAALAAVGNHMPREAQLEAFRHDLFRWLTSRDVGADMSQAEQWSMFVDRVREFGTMRVGS